MPRFGNSGRRINPLAFQRMRCPHFILIVLQSSESGKEVSVNLPSMSSRPLEVNHEMKKAFSCDDGTYYFK